MIDLSGFMPAELTEQLRFILDLGGAIVAALIGGAIAVRLRQPAIVGYMLAGVVIGPFTPGFVGGQEQIAILAEVGVVLLLFALGVEFSIRELRSVGRVVIPGGVAQVLLTLGIGTLVMALLGTDLRESLIVGACLALSSTIVVLKQLIDRGEMDSAHGRAAVGWSIVQDIATIVFIVALPPLVGGDVIVPFAIAMVKAAVFLAIAYVLGTRLLPWMFATVARLGSSELFLLAVVATALMTAFVSSAVFGLSLALGAFVAGVLVSESELSHQAAAEVTPFRDLFAVLFFVSVGMLVDPAALMADAPMVAVLVVVAVLVKGVSIAVLGRALGLPTRSAILLGAIMAQVGEFSLILAENGRQLDLLDARTYNIVLGTAVVTIVLSPFVTRLGDRLVARRESRVLVGAAGDAAGEVGASTLAAGASRTEQAITANEEARRPGIVVLGAGRVGRVVVTAARGRGFRCVVVDRDARRLETVKRLGAATVFGDAANPEILKRLGLDRARVLVITIGDPLTARLAAERARILNPRVQIASRARGKREIATLQGLGVARLADPEAEVAFELARHALQRMGVSGPELNGVVMGLRREAYGRDRG